MKDEIVNYETACIAKDKGFDESCSQCYELDRTLYELSYYEGDATGFVKNSEMVDGNGTENMLCTAPTQSLLQRWLREKHRIIISVVVDYFDDNDDESSYYSFTLHQGSKPVNHDFDDPCDTYEEAVEYALNEALKLIK